MKRQGLIREGSEMNSPTSPKKRVKVLGSENKGINIEVKTS